MNGVLYETIGILFNDDGWERFVFRFSRKDIPIIKQAKAIFLQRLKEKEIGGGFDGKFKYLMKLIHNLKDETKKGYKIVGMGVEDEK